MTKPNREPTFKYALALSSSDKLLVDQIMKNKQIPYFADAIRYAIRLAAMPKVGPSQIDTGKVEVPYVTTPAMTQTNPSGEQQVCTPNVPS
jgi:hypothetical protein